MKKILTLLLITALLLSLCACSTDTAPAETVPTETKAPLEICFDNTLVIDSASCTIEITGIDPEGAFGYSLSVRLENKTPAKQLFSVISASTNGVTNDPYFAAEVDAGQQVNQTIIFSDTALESRIGPYTDIYLRFRVSDSGDWFSDPVAETDVHVYPYGEDHVTAYERVSQSTDTVLVDNQQVTVIVTHCKTDMENDGCTAHLYLVNKTDTTVMFSVSEAAVNGVTIDPYYAADVPGGCSAFSEINWSAASLSEQGITQVDTVTLKLRAYNYEDWLADDYVQETFTLTPNTKK